MEISLLEVFNPSPEQVALQDEGFTVDYVLVLRAENNRVEYSFQPVEPYPKRYKPPGWPAGASAFVAYAGDHRAGRIVLQQNWNRLASIEDLCVDRAFRCQGIGARLLACAEAWARARALPGIRLETQSNNAAACRLYARCGFKLCGFDTHLYRGIAEVSDETALYWYRMLT